MKKYGNYTRNIIIDDEIKCGECVRLEHMLTSRNLHSHPHLSPFTGN